MTGCCVPRCTSSHARGQRMFRFPRNCQRRKKWEAQVKRDCWHPTDSTKICELHFEDSQFEANRQDGRRLLKCTAIPTLFDFMLGRKDVQTQCAVHMDIKTTQANIRPHTRSTCIQTKALMKDVECQTNLELPDILLMEEVQ
ncbi:peroxynitrite isomerase THAP4 [Rhipicephalus sanguineus]|uniref:peroxynitrite isomerase THAP4 n=1 Tax=Rhipicephalus sanguineus TaxID=34632 RepID=UPI0018947D0D|nr:peroxynitrite isomerase THAP4 [Rhipicephalus sanguineus]